MGGFFAGLGSALGGAGQAATQYGHQVREQLESRRNHLAELLSKTAESTADPTARAALYSHVSDLLSGKPIGAIAEGFQKTVQAHQADHQKLLNVFPPPEQKQQPTVAGAPGPGQAPGTNNQVPIQPISAAGEAPSSEANARTSNGIMPVQAQAQPPAPVQASPAAQPATNPTQGGGGIAPVQPQAQAQAQPQAPAIAPIFAPASAPAPASATAPTAENATAHLYPPGSYGRQLIDQMTAMQSSVGGVPQWLSAEAQPYLQKEAAFAEEQAMREYKLSIGPKNMQAINRLVAESRKSDPQFAGLPPMYQYSYAASSLGLPAPAIPAMAMMPRLFSGGTMGSQAPPGTMKYGTQTPVEPNERYRIEIMPMTGETMWIPEATPTELVAGAGGQALPRNKFTGEIGEAAPGVVMPSTAPKTTQNTSTTIKDINGEMVPVTTGSGHVTTVGGGTPAAGGGTVKPAAAPRPRGAGVGPTARVGTALGDSQGTFNMRAQNPITAAGQTVMQQTGGTMVLVDKALKLLEAKKDDNSPMPLAVSRALYGLGISDENSNLINALELGRLQAAGQVFKGAGGTRSFMMLEKALVHTPGSLNSYKLMYEKLQTVKQNLNGLRASVQQEMKKYPGLKPKAGEEIAPVEAGTVPSAVQKLLASETPGVHTLSDGSKWKKNLDGTIEAQ